MEISGAELIKIGLKNGKTFGKRKSWNRKYPAKAVEIKQLC
ncbi:hypothetical protein [Methylomonas albis]|nr:hypothetical protein [Methylomonas albis]